jgi:hypothetical protein
MKNSTIRQAEVLNTIEGNTEDALLDIKNGEELISVTKETGSSKCYFWLGMVLSALMILAVVYFYLNLK